VCVFCHSRLYSGGWTMDAIFVIGMRTDNHNNVIVISDASRTSRATLACYINRTRGYYDFIVYAGDTGCRCKFVCTTSSASVWQLRLFHGGYDQGIHRYMTVCCLSPSQTLLVTENRKSQGNDSWESTGYSPLPSQLSAHTFCTTCAGVAVYRCRH